MAASTAATLERSPSAREVEPTRRPSGGLLATALRRLRRDRVTVTAAGLLILYAVLALGAEFIATQVFNTSPTKIDLSSALQPPSRAHWLGTDEFGRDQLVRVLYGARVSLLIGLCAALINLTVGVSLGALAGYFGGRVDGGV